MKKFSLLSVWATLCILVSCQQAPKEPAASATADTTKKEEAKTEPNISYPYTAMYTSSFELGDPRHSKTVLDIWKAWEGNKLAETKDSWADSVSFDFGDGSSFKGSRDSALAMGTKERSGYTNVVDSVVAWIPLRTKETKEDWVLIWADEYRTQKNGKKISLSLHEGWQLKNGKVASVFQFSKPKK